MCGQWSQDCDHAIAEHLLIDKDKTIAALTYEVALLAAERDGLREALAAVLDTPVTPGHEFTLGTELSQLNHRAFDAAWRALGRDGDGAKGDENG